jgi:hypothetical protein
MSFKNICENMKELFKIYKYISNQRNKRKSFMMPIFCSIRENWDVEIRQISL